MFTLGILTSSDMGSKGEREDTSGEAIREILTPLGFTVQNYEVVPDEAEIISARLTEWADSGEIDLIVTTGGTGLGPRDVTPEATQAVIHRPVPGIAEAMRQAGMSHTPFAMISRGTAGARGSCLIINLPGSPRGVRENLEAVVAVIPHALETLKKGQNGNTPNSIVMDIHILTLFPDMFRGPFDESIVKRAVERGLASIHIHNIRDYAQ